MKNDDDGVRAEGGEARDIVMSNKLHCIPRFSLVAYIARLRQCAWQQSN